MAQDFVIRIRADDAATATVKKIQAALGKITEPVDKAQKRLGKLGDLGSSSIGKLEKAFAKSTRAAIGLVDRIAEMVPGLAAIGSAASLAGIAALTTRFGNFGFSLNKTSRLLGMNAQDLAAWHVAAKRAGVSADAFDSAMSGSQMVIRNAAFGADPHALTILQKMHVAIARNQDGSVNYLKTQLALMGAIRAQKSVEAQRDVADTFSMGGMLPMIQGGNWDADRARAWKKGLVPTPAELARAQQLHNDINDLEDSVTGFGNSIGSSLMPVLDPVVKKLAQWFDKNRAQLADKIAKAVQKFVEWLSKIDWNAVSAKAHALWDDLGGVKRIVEAIALITFAGPIAGALSLIGSIAQLAMVTIPAAAGAFGALGVAAAIAYAALHPDDLNEGEDAYLKARQAQPGQQWPGDPVGQQHHQVAAEALKNPETAHAVALLQSMGWSKAQAAGLVASGWIESNLRPNIVGDDGHAYGAFQWHEDRQKDFKDWAGHDIHGSTLDEQIRFLNYDLRYGKNWAAGRRLHAATTAEDAGRIVSKYYERPANVDLEMDKRGSLASAIDSGEAPDYTPAQAGDASSQSAAAAGHDARVAQLQAASLHISFDNVPAGVRPSAKDANGALLPTRVTYRFGES